jgi:hypothetical protein
VAGDLVTELAEAVGLPGDDLADEDEQGDGTGASPT